MIPSVTMTITITALAAVKRDIMTYHISSGPEDNNGGRVAEDIVGDGAHIPLLLGNQAPLFAFLKTKINTTMTRLFVNLKSNFSLLPR